jgi:hypothetical protein
MSELDTLIEKYRISSAKHGSALEAAKPKAANKEFDTILALKKELRSRGEEGWQRLRPLLQAQEQGTRYWAAAFLLDFVPDEAERVLSELASIPKSFVGLSAELTLNKWKNGTLKLT